MEGMEEEEEEKKWCCIAHHFHRAASSNPGKVAVIHAFGGALLSRHRRIATGNVISNPPLPPPFIGDECFTFSQLLSAVDSLCFRLRQALDDPCLRIPKPSDNPYMSTSTGIETSDPKRCKMFHERDRQKIVAVYMVPSVYYITAVLSILRCGEAFMPLDPSWPKVRVLSVLSSSNVDLIICCQNSKRNNYATNQLEESDWLTDSCHWPVLYLSMDEFGMEKSCQFKSPWPCESAKSRTFSYVMCTSGSTGKPKGVCGTEEGLLNRFWWLQELYPLKGDEFLLFKTPISFIDHIQEFLAAILAASTLVIPPVNELKENMFSLVDFLLDYSISRLTAVPSLVKAVLAPLRSPYYVQINSSLKLLLLSGESFHISLWHALSSLLPRTSILNIYGSTEVSGDCTYFDCKWLPILVESHMISSVPIGNPLTNCNVILQKDGELNEGEICVNGCCLANGYISEKTSLPFNYVELPDDSLSTGVCQKKFYFRTGDFAKRLPSGHLVFLGRKDRTVKVNGQRIALEEVEDTLRVHPEVVDAAVVFNKDEREYAFLSAFVVLKKDRSDIITSIKRWLIEKLPTAMIPKEILCIEALPTSFSGKVDYVLLSEISSTSKSADQVQMVEVVEKLKKAFSHALAVEFSHDSNFFEMGGDSVSAAHVAHDLGIDMRLIYMFPTPSDLQKALLEKEDLLPIDEQLNWDALPKDEEGIVLHSESESSGVVQLNAERTNLTMIGNNSSTHYIEPFKFLEVDQNLHLLGKGQNFIGIHYWKPGTMENLCAIARSNRVFYYGDNEGNDLCCEVWEAQLPRQSSGLLQESWKVHMESCIDASPVIIFGGEEVLLFIGSHSHIFLCINARSGSVQWEIKLEGRIECSAVTDGDFQQVIVGCYKGKIYFIDIKSGKIHWSFQTNGEVKSQPFVDKYRHLVWCGSHDHTLYALDYRNHCCVYQFPCGGSVYSSPVIDEGKSILYVATTTGYLTAISLKNLLFSKLWLFKLKAPIFGSLVICSLGNVICCAVNGYVISVNCGGSIVWKIKMDGPIFAGACISRLFPSQGIICTRGGSVYCLELANGSIIWQYNVGAPITASAYVDEHSKLNHDPTKPGDRLICVCSSSGKILLLRSNMVSTVRDEEGSELVEKFAELDLCGDIFSSPVMIGGRIFVGGRDDYLHCFVVKAPEIKDHDLDI